MNDCIMEIDGVPMLGSTLKHAHATVLGAPDSIVTFKVSRRKTPKPSQPVSPQSARVVSPRTGAAVSCVSLEARCAKRYSQLAALMLCCLQVVCCP